ncbi:MAG TPA: PEPxxWA-CTERM sorting domain-containing protein [Polyangia bacterium]|nr:PEPxxWA-CTERM sorting domain-containing protein [Polyangia bacterium]
MSAAVPEPASWALMIIGFGGLGAGLRRTRRNVASAATA